LSVKVKPEGRAPDSDREAVGLAVEVTVNELEIVSAKLVLSADVMTGAASTVRVKDWEASGLIPLEACIVKGYEPPVPAAGVPDRVAVPSPLSTRFTPDGSEPVSDKVAVGLPVEVTVKDPAVPTVKVVAAAEVMVGAASTVRVKDWEAAGLMPLAAWMVKVYEPPVPAAGVPDRVAVPSPLLARVTPEGSEPVSDSEAVGLPVEVTVKLPWLPTVKVVAAAEVMAGATSTVRVKDWEAAGVMPLEAPMVKL
jgi:hypothetical protein